MNELRNPLAVPSGASAASLAVEPAPTHPRQTPDRRSTPPKVSAADELICFAHLRWNFVYQRPQHLLSRATRHYRVWYVEEPIWGDPAWNGVAGLAIQRVNPQLTVVVPHLPHGLSPEQAVEKQQVLLDELLSSQQIRHYALWYYTPMALPFSKHLTPRLTVYDCMDELSAFLGASPLLIEQERQLLQQADVVFTGGHSLYEAKQNRHARVFAFPSCIDYDHFAQARADTPDTALPDPADQAAIAPGPRIGYSGVIDERLNLTLIGELAARRPDWQFVFLGPIVKINPESLPHAANIHYLGMKSYDELPAYFSHWQAAMMPFAINEATRYISPTKTPEYLAAGLPVISTPIRDVLRTYGCWDRVVTADSVGAFQAGISLVLGHTPGQSSPQLDEFLRKQSWENTWQQMQQIINSQPV